MTVKTGPAKTGPARRLATAMYFCTPQYCFMYLSASHDHFVYLDPGYEASAYYAKFT